jgi:TfoX/Sxy family transcriptional regulator of competence genes
VAYDQDLADRVRAVLPAEAITERQMFGGLAFMLAGHMVCGIVNDNLMVRLALTVRNVPWTSHTCGRWTSPDGP